MRAWSRWLLAPFLIVLSMSAQSASLKDEWSAVHLPAMPPLKPAQVDARTAFFMISMTKETCNQTSRPRCFATIGPVKKILDLARQNHLLVIHSLTRGAAERDKLVEELAPRAGEPILPPGPGPDKFIGSDLLPILVSHGIQTLIVVGTQAQTAVLHTGAGAAFRGYRVIVPIDGMSSDDAFPELYTAYHLATTSRIGEFVTLTSSDLVQFKP